MELSPSVSEGPEYFRVYSDRQRSGLKGTAGFVWNPTMDLLAEHSGAEVSVHRLIPEDDEACLFQEQLPFVSNCVTWHPSGRELAVGDVQGNVFILTAEPEDERRLHEIQKLHGSAVSSLQWIPFGNTDSESGGSFALPCSFYSYAKLPVLEAAGNPGASRVNSLLATLSQSGHMAFLLDGWLPVADLRLPRCDQSQYIELVAKPDGREFVALACDEGREYVVFIADTAVLVKQAHRLLLTAEMERDGLDVLKEMHSLLENTGRLLHAVEEEFWSRLELPEVHALGDAGKLDSILKRLDEIFSATKLTKWEKVVLELLDQLMINSFVHMERLGDRFLLVMHELRPKTQCPTVLSSAQSIKAEIRKLQATLRLKYHAMKQVFTIVNAVVCQNTSQVRPLEGRFAESLGVKLELSGIRAGIKEAETGVVRVMAFNREENSKNLCIKTCFKISQALKPSLAWKPQYLEIIWTNIEDRTLLHVVRMEEAAVFKTVLDMGDLGNMWLVHSSYRDEICVCVGSEAGSSLCLLSVDCTTPVSPITRISEVEPYRISVDQLRPDAVKAQQLPPDFSGLPESLAVSSNRGLASIAGHSRLITIDLEPEDEQSTLN